MARLLPDIWLVNNIFPRNPQRVFVNILKEYFTKSKAYPLVRMGFVNLAERIRLMRSFIWRRGYKNIAMTMPRSVTTNESWIANHKVIISYG